MVRLKNRYLTIKLDLVNIPMHKLWNVSGFKIRTAVLNAVETLHGDFGIAVCSSSSVKYFNSETRICILRCRHGPHRLLASALPFVTKLKDETLQMHTLHTAATLKKSYKFLMKYQMNFLREFYSGISGCKDDYAELEKNILDIDSSKTGYHHGVLQDK